VLGLTARVSLHVVPRKVVGAYLILRRPLFMSQVAPRLEETCQNNFASEDETYCQRIVGRGGCRNGASAGSRWRGAEKIMSRVPLAISPQPGVYVVAALSYLSRMPFYLY
jgi:hypothetical protein